MFAKKIGGSDGRQIGKWIDGPTGEPTGKWIDGLIDERIDRWGDKLIDKWIDGPIEEAVAVIDNIQKDKAGIDFSALSSALPRRLFSSFHSHLTDKKKNTHIFRCSLNDFYPTSSSFHQKVVISTKGRYLGICVLYQDFSLCFEMTFS